ncbi:hypothetical protein [Actinophytocola sp.]|uniref:hypothetical protein n=1 Tax=Actinophytocola sp. TaxID=1872138 RepID=UPI002D3DB0A6|nr:hypothetical protein [Actinophytocola sp.]HYQ69097.1 hypothetical protein [Actinophytocola sp.]
MTTARVDMIPAQALELAAHSPHELTRFLDSLDDSTLALVGELAHRVDLAVGREQLHREFVALWDRVGLKHKRSRLWPDAEPAPVEEPAERTQVPPADAVAAQDPPPDEQAVS